MLLIPSFSGWLCCTELQSHRIVKVGRGLWRPSGLTPLLKQRYLKQVVQDYLQVAFGDL